MEQGVTGHSKPATFHRYVTSEVSSVLGQQDIGDKINFCYQIFEANAIRISRNDNKSLSLADKNAIISRFRQK